jgi:glutamyl/glutaminyl-tRNA synthetase
MPITRFCPTLTGDADVGVLHIGHLYNILVNEHYAHSTGGFFHLKMDDNQRWWTHELGRAKMYENGYKVLEELEWMGIKVDKISWQSDTEWFVQRIVADRFPDLKELLLHKEVPFVHGNNDPQYPYAPYLTAEAVLTDAAMGVDTLIIGDELRDRYALYNYFCDAFGLPYPKTIHIKRMKCLGNELDAISKTRGNHKLQSYIDAGWCPTRVRELLEASCLIDIHKGWVLENVREQPILLEQL